MQCHKTAAVPLKFCNARAMMQCKHGTVVPESAAVPLWYCNARTLMHACLLDFFFAECHCHYGTAVPGQ